MVSISSKFLPFTPLIDYADAVADQFCGQGYPLHEVDAHLLEVSGCHEVGQVTVPSQQVVNHPSVTSRRDVTWNLQLSEAMCGEEPVAVVTLRFEQVRVRDQVHCVLTISDFKQLRTTPSLPYALRRIALIKLGEAVWSTLTSHSPDASQALQQHANSATQQLLVRAG